MNHKAISFILEIIMLASIGTLLLFFISEIVLGLDVFFAYHFVAIAIASISIVLWYWYQYHVAFTSRTTPVSKTDARSSRNYSQTSRFNPVSGTLITCGP